MAEYWDLYDGAGQKTGETHLRGGELPAGRFHKVVHIWIQNSRGELLMQKRSDKVDNCPGIWATTGGSVQAGEEPLPTAVRELSEELGITVLPEELRYCLTVRRKDAFCYIYLLKKEKASMKRSFFCYKLEWLDYCFFILILLSSPFKSLLMLE